MTLPRYVLINGDLVAAATASVSVFDRGLQYGDGLFETLRVYAGRGFAIAEHIARLRASARVLGIPMPRIDWQAAVERLLVANALDGDGWVRILLTRGPAAPGLLPPRNPHPTLVVLAGALDPRLTRAACRGVGVELLPFAVEGPLAGHKILSYLPAILGKRAAQRRGAYEGLYVDRRRLLSEGTTSNVFVVAAGRVTTPAEVGILPGVTRRKAIELCRRLGLSVREKAVRSDDLISADEAFLSSSLAEIVPIVRVGGSRLATGRPGPITKTLQIAYKNMIEAVMLSHETQRATNQ